MHPFQALIRFAALVMLLFAANSARAAEPDGLQLTPLVASVLAPPHAFPGSDGRVHLVYEVRIANGTGTRLRLERIGVADAKGGAPLATLDAAAIGGRLSLGGRRGSEARELGPFQFGVVFLHVTLAAGAPVPARLVHTIEGSLDEPRADITVRVAETSVAPRPSRRSGRRCAGMATSPQTGAAIPSVTFARSWRSTAPFICRSALPSTGNASMRRGRSFAAIRRTSAAITSMAMLFSP